MMWRLKEMPRYSTADSSVSPLHYNQLRLALRRLPGKLRIEAGHVHAIYAGIAQDCELCRQPGQSRGGRMWGKKLPRMRLERQYAGRYMAFRRLVLQTREHGGVPTVHAIKIADRKRARADLGRRYGEGLTMRDEHAKEQ